MAKARGKGKRELKERGGRGRFALRMQVAKFQTWIGPGKERTWDWGLDVDAKRTLTERRPLFLRPVKQKHQKVTMPEKIRRKGGLFLIPFFFLGGRRV